MQGNVGIGTTDPGALLTVYESSGSQTSHFDSYDGVALDKYSDVIESVVSAKTES